MTTNVLLGKRKWVMKIFYIRKDFVNILKLKFERHLC